MQDELPTAMTMTVQLYSRLLDRYGPLLSVDDIATELRCTRAVIYLRRSRQRTDGMPAPISESTPLRYRAADIALWLAGDAVPSAPSPAAAPRRRKPGRPRKVAGAES